jgi:hypothetical protein
MHCAHERNVFPKSMVEIAADIGVRSIFDLSRRVRKPIPDGFTLPVLFPGALDLVGSRSRSPVEILWK